MGTGTMSFTGKRTMTIPLGSPWAAAQRLIPLLSTAGWGVYEGKDRLLAMGLAVPSEVREVYLANHTRAILDLLYRSLTR